MLSLKLGAVARLTAIATLTTLTACGHNYAPGPGATFADLAPVKARCSLMARHGGGGFSAYGRPGFVAAAGALNLLAETARTVQDMDDCMAMNGFQIVAAPVATTAPVYQQPIAAPVVTQAPSSQQPMTARAAEIGIDAQMCLKAVRVQPAFESIHPHFADLETGRYTPEQLADTRIPTPVEGVLLTAYGAASAPCSEAATSAVVRAAPAAASILLDMRRIGDADFAALAQRQMSWGEYSARSTRIRAETTLRLRALRS